MTHQDLEMGKMYIFDQTEKYDRYHAIIKVTKIRGWGMPIHGKPVDVFVNTFGWVNRELSLGEQHFVEEITADTHPQYFL